MDFRNHIFKTAGTVSGIFFGLGIFGVIFGLTGGTLIDQLVKWLRQKKRLKIFLSCPGKLKHPYPELPSAAAAAIAWKLCEKDPFKRSVLESSIHRYLKKAPRCSLETLKELDEIDYAGVEQYFKENADVELFEQYERLCDACGISPGAGNTEKPADKDFEILGLEPGASRNEVKKVYHRLAAQFHPDSGRNLSEEQQYLSTEAFKKIKEAYERINR